MFGFRKVKKQIILPPISGEIIPLEAVPDKVFSKKMLGDGFAVIGDSKWVVAPVSGRLIHIFSTKHAFCLLTDDGLEVLVHVGIDTVHLRGQGFTVKQKEGDHVLQGDVVFELDLTILQQHSQWLMTPVVITNRERIQSLKINYGCQQPIAGEVQFK